MAGRLNFKVLSAMLAAVTLLALLAGCAPAAVPAAQAPAQPATTSAPAPAGGAPTAAAAAASNQPVELTFWWWAESDAPGADKWLQETIAAYQKLHPNITVKMVPQSTDTLISAFTAAASAKSGPDIASQWATIPVLSQAWAGAVTPISDLVPADEIKHWANTNENMYNGKLWAAPLYLLGIPLAYNKDLFKQAGLDPEKPPTTFDELLQDCETLKKAGITCMAGGAAKASAFGAWMFAILGVQDLDSVDDIKAAAVGDVPITSEKYTRWLSTISDMIKKGYFNDNIASLDYVTAQDLFPQGKVAMSWGTDGNVAAWAKTLGEDKVGVIKTPKYGKGKLADAYDATQSTSFFVTSWSQHPKEAADFIQFMHTPERLAAWYKGTAVVPADDRFDTKTITDTLQAKLAAFNLSPQNVWLENFIPTQMDTDGLRQGGSALASGSSPKDVADSIDRTLKLWRSQNPKEVETFKNWK
jgi:raffinose/stachyose/melibiose transport system substrate-binding protein